MKKYAIVVTLICLGLIIYILMGQPAADKSSSTKASSSYSASVYQPSTQTRATAKPISSVNTYVLNKNTKVFHKPSCSSVKQMKESNKRTYTGTRAQVIDMGYRPCQRCNPK